jgi:hypothetical protein
MLVVGGFIAKAKVVLDDFNLYDAKLNCWIKVKVTNKRKVFTP